MSFSWNKRKIHVSITAFIEAIKSGERDFLKLLGTAPHEMKLADFDQLMSNTDDVLAGVNKVEMNFQNRYFNLFDSILVKHHDNGDVKLVFYTETRDVKAITDFAGVFFSLLGIGIYDNRRFFPFTNYQKIKEIAERGFSAEQMEIVHSWWLSDVHFMLQYRNEPLHQFSLMVTKSLPKTKDHAIRRKGTILNALQLDIQKILIEEPVSLEETKEDGTVKFVDYTYALEHKQWDAFDHIRIRVFGPKRTFDETVQTHITLFSYDPIPSEVKIRVAESLLRIYGSEDKEPYLELFEREVIEEGGFWTGLSWTLNQEHGLFRFDAGESMSYQVEVNDLEDEEGFKVHVLSFNELVTRFSEM